MTTFELHDESTAPEASKPMLAASKKSFGMIPGLHAVMAEAPGLLQAYRQAHELFVNSSFDKDEITVVWQTINVEHACHYCVPAHTGISKSMGVSDDISDALRNETPLPNARLEALRTFTLNVVLVLGTAQKVMSNYTNHLAQTPIDAPFKKFEWQKVS